MLSIWKLVRSSSISGALEDDEPELAEDLGDLAHRLDAGMEGPAPDRPARRRDVERLGGEAPRLRGAPQVRAPRRERPFDGRTNRVRDCADPWPVLRRQRADAAQDGGQATLLAQDVELERLEGGDVAHRGDRGEGVVAERFEVACQVGEVHVGPSMHGPWDPAPPIVGDVEGLSRGVRTVPIGTPPDRCRIA